ncbi:MAG: hypothetical protein OJF51_000476 [Nitrospira sp.]|nr:MAG: hypothetical protein OJF51_000476 [Nitrospira sp.]
MRAKFNIFTMIEHVVFSHRLGQFRTAGALVESTQEQVGV